MKTMSEILSQTPVYLHNWNEKIDMIGSFEDIYMTGEEFRLTESPYSNTQYFYEKQTQMKDAIEKYSEYNVLFASYGEDNYSGEAWVLYEQNGRLYEVNGSHCSCYGLEGQWEPEEVTLDEIEHRLTKGTFGEDDYSGNEFKQELKVFLGVN